MRSFDKKIAATVAGTALALAASGVAFAFWTTAGSGESYTVNDSAKVVCGNVKTANATVYIVDSVLMPTS